MVRVESWWLMSYPVEGERCVFIELMTFQEVAGYEEGKDDAHPPELEGSEEERTTTVRELEWGP